MRQGVGRRALRLSRPLGVVLLFGCSPSSQQGAPQAPAAANESVAGKRADARRTPPAAASAVRPLAECTIRRSGPNLVFFECGALELRVMRLESNDLERVFSQPKFKEWKREPIELGGASFPGARLFEHPERVGLAVVVASASEPRFLTCFAERTLPDGEGACRAHLKSMVVDGELRNVAFGDAPLRIGAQELVIPESCERVTPDRIRCPSAELHWRNPNPSCRVSGAEAKQGFEAMLARVGKVTHESKPCVALGEPRTCDKYVITPANEPAVTVLAAIQGCLGTTLQCNFLTPPGERFPAPCDQVFSGRP